jgi:hypothetical protein
MLLTYLINVKIPINKCALSITKILFLIHFLIPAVVDLVVIPALVEGRGSEPSLETGGPGAGGCAG